MITCLVQDRTTLTAITPEVISRQATINIGKYVCVCVCVRMCVCMCITYVYVYAGTCIFVSMQFPCIHTHYIINTCVKVMMQYV